MVLWGATNISVSRKLYPVTTSTSTTNTTTTTTAITTIISTTIAMTTAATITAVCVTTTTTGPIRVREHGVRVHVLSIACSDYCNGLALSLLPSPQPIRYISLISQQMSSFRSHLPHATSSSDQWSLGGRFIPQVNPNRLHLQILRSYFSVRRGPSVYVLPD